MKVNYYMDEKEISTLVNEWLDTERNRKVRELVHKEIESIVNYCIAKRREEIEERIWKQIEWAISDAMESQGGKSRINRMADILNRVIKKEIDKYGVSL